MVSSVPFKREEVVFEEGDCKKRWGGIDDAAEFGGFIETALPRFAWPGETQGRAFAAARGDERLGKVLTHLLLRGQDADPERPY